MTAQMLVFNQFAGRLDSVDGKLIGAALVDDSFAPSGFETDIDSITGEVSGAGYARGQFTGDWDTAALVARVAADAWPTFDISATATPVTGVVFFYDDSGPDAGKVISFIPYEEQTPVSGWVLQPLNGFARATQGGPIEGRLTAAEAAIAAGAAGVATIVAGDNVTVDATDPQNPIVSATAGGSGPAGAVLAVETAGVSDVAAAIDAGAEAATSSLTSTLTTINLPALPSASEGSGFVLYLVSPLVSPGSLDDVTFTVEGGGTADVVGSFDLAAGGGVYAWRVEPYKKDSDFQWELFPLTDGSGGGSGLVGAVIATETAGVADVASVIDGGAEATTVELTATLTTIDLPAAPTTATGPGFAVFLVSPLVSPGSLDDVSFTVEGGGDATVIGSVDLGSGFYAWRVEPARGLDSVFAWVLWPLTDGSGGGSFPVDAEFYDLTGETPGDLTLDLSDFPIDKAAAVVQMPNGSDQTLVIATPAGVPYGHIDVTVFVVSGSVTVFSASNSIEIASKELILDGPQFAFAALVGFDDFAAMMLVPYGFNVAAGAGSGDVVGSGVSTAHHFAKFADTSGSLLEDGGPAGGAASLDVGTGSGDVAAGNAPAAAITAHSAATDPHGDRAYTDAQITAALANFDFKASVRAASTSNVASLSGTTTIDGVSLVAGDRVLLTGQSTGSQNGIWVVASGAWSRTADADVSAEVTSGMAVGVTEGTSNGDAFWLLTTNDPITLGTTALSFTKLPMVAGLSPASNLSDLTNAATARTNLGLAIGSNVQAWSAVLDAFVALTPTNDDLLQRKAGSWTNRTPAQVKTDLALTKSDVGLSVVTNDAQVKRSEVDAFIFTLLDDTSAAAARTTLGAAASADSFKKSNTSNQDNNTATLADITGLDSPVQAVSTTWEYEWTIHHGNAATSTAGIDFSLTVPTGATVIYNCFGPRSGSAPSLLMNGPGATAGGTRISLGNGASGSPIWTTKLFATVTTDGTHSGAITPQFAQTTGTGATNTRVFAGSVAKGNRIP